MQQQGASITVIEMGTNPLLSDLVSKSSCGIIFTNSFLGRAINEISKAGFTILKGKKTKLIVEDSENSGLDEVQEKLAASFYEGSRDVSGFVVLCSPETALGLQRSIPAVKIYRPDQRESVQIYDIFKKNDHFYVGCLDVKNLSC